MALLTTRRRSTSGVLTAVLLLWFVIGALAAGQRGYFRGDPETCARWGTIVVTILAGPLNYVGANPKISCALPQPSR